MIFSSARLSILFNGKLHGYFPCTKGVRQGDPLSPILFGIAEDALRRLFFNKVTSGVFKPMKYTRFRVFPFHILYADDILIFCKATTKNAKVCQDILHKYGQYGQISSQICNAAESHVYFGKWVSLALKRNISHILRFQQSDIPFSYLGVPLFVGHPRARHLIVIKDKILGHFPKWKGLQLSMAGRICLVRLVIQSSIIHSMLVYKWPASLLHDIDKACRNFIWTGSISS